MGREFFVELTSAHLAEYGCSQREESTARKKPATTHTSRSLVHTWSHPTSHPTPVGGERKNPVPVPYGIPYRCIRKQVGHHPLARLGSIAA